MNTEMVPSEANAGELLEKDGIADVHRAREISIRLKEYIDNGKIKPVIIQGKEHLLIQHWQFLATATGLSVRIAWTKQIEVKGGTGYEARAEVINEQTGAIVGAGESMCVDNEKRGPWSNADMYAIRAMAQTRACARALRQKLAYIVVLANYEPTPAEEMDGQGASAAKSPREELAEIVRGMEDGAVSYLVSVGWLPEGRTLADLDDKHVSACVKMSSKFIDAITKHMNKKADPDTRRIDEIPESEIEELF